MSALLQAEIRLEDYTEPGADLLVEAIADLTHAAGGEATFGVLVGGTLIMALWIAGDGDLATPAVVTVLVGSLMFPVLPAGYLGIARVISFLGLTAAILAALEKFYLEGTQ